MTKLYEDMAWPTDAAMNALEGELRAAAARLARKKRERREARLFVLALVAATALACGVGFCVVNGLPVAGAPIAWAIAACVGLTALFTPVLAYFAEEGKYEREAE